MNISQKGATKRLIRSELAKHTGRPMTNKASKKYLRKSRKGSAASYAGQPSLIPSAPTFRWPHVNGMPTSYRGMASFARFPALRPLPIGWKRLTLPGVTEAIDLPLFLWWGINGVTWVQQTALRVFAFCIGLRRVKA